MESVIIEEMRAFMRLDLNPRQKQYFADTIAVAKRVDIVRAADVFNDYELEIIRDILKPQPQQCYRNAHLLCQLFPERVRYCEGKTFAFIPIEHAFNRVGDKYVDITFEFALQDAELLDMSTLYLANTICERWNELQGKPGITAIYTEISILSG